jgi:hypothetical protein
MNDVDAAARDASARTIGPRVEALGMYDFIILDAPTADEGPARTHDPCPQRPSDAS